MEGGINTRFPAGVLVYCIGPALWRWSIPFSEQRESSWCASPSLPSWRPTQASLALEACPEGEMLNTLAVKGSLTSHLLVSRCNEKMRCQLLLCCVDEGGTSVSVAVGVGLGFCGFWWAISPATGSESAFIVHSCIAELKCESKGARWVPKAFSGKTIQMFLLFLSSFSRHSFPLWLNKGAVTSFLTVSWSIPNPSVSHVACSSCLWC